MLKSIYIAWCRLLTRISPVLNNQFIYLVFYRKILHLHHPQTMHEKLVYLKLNQYNENRLVKTCADKYAVRSYLRSKGLEGILVPLIASYDNIDSIDWSALPQKFAMKINYGCGYNIICKDKAKLDEKAAIIKLKKWVREEKYLNEAELQYKDVPLKIIVEKYLQPASGDLPSDYKIYCFNGKPMVILYMNDRGKKTKAAFFDMNWKYISAPISKKGYVQLDELPAKPICIEQMKEIARILSQPFPFVRIDLYCVDSKIYFGEMTFTPASGLFTSECLIEGRPMGDYLKIKIN